MVKPEPQIGQIVKFDYLWRNEVTKGREEGSKERPCAVVIARRLEADGTLLVLLAPITHSPPGSDTPAIEIPAQAQQVTGLDRERSWLIVNEVNLVPWNDPGIVPAKQGQWLYGHLPRIIAIKASDAIKGFLRLGKMKIINRT